MWPAPRSTARRSSRATFHEEGNATMAKFGAGGGLFKLDAICDKLKTNLTSRQEAHGAVAPAANHVTENGVDGHAGEFRSSEEPNNNTDGLEKAVSLASHECSDYDEQNSSRQRQPVHDSAGDPDDQERVSPEARRKSRRKSCHPRNISNMTNKRQLAGYEVNNAGIDFGAICRSAMEDEEEEEEADADDVGEWQDGQLRIFYRNDDPSIRSDSELSCASHEDGAVREPASVRASPDANSDVLDLSMSKPNGARPERDPERGHYADVSEENGVLNLSLGQRETPPSGSSGHASPAKGMKEYAEDTMNELLSMYGLTDDGGGSGTLEAANLNAEIFARKRHLVNSQNNSNDSSADSSLLEPTLNKRMKLELDEEDDNDLKRSPGRPANNRIGAPGCYAKAVGNQLLQDKSADHVLSPTSQTTPPDYCKYLKRFNSYEECRGNHCEDMGYKEHFHCLDCSFRVFVKKEEMIRHFKWHKKRDESLQHGFMRYSPVDDCSKKFPGSCTHNGKQTHYHCLQAGCSKVYISTSDVQMHANYHRKDSAILREGFQRFRATEDCGTPTCSFYNQRTTHFHCRRPGCTFTFKNKADMEKHKTYHQKDEILTKDGFKKFMKYEHCSFPGCRYSKTSNHIHCIRPGCHYVLHSTGQLYSHKRKHERANYDRAYRRLNMDSHSGRSLAVVSQHLLPSGASSQGMFTNTSTIKKEFADLKDPQAVGHSEIQDAADNSPATSEMSPGSQHNLSMTSLSSAASDPDGTAIVPSGGATVKMEPLDGGGAVLEHSKVPYSTIAKLVSKLNHHPPSDSMALPVQGQSGVGTAPPPLIGVVPGTPAPISVPGAGVRPPSPTTAVGPGGFVPKVSPPVNEKKERDESWKKFLTRYTANDPCHSRCQFLYKDHYHCNTPNCGLLFRSKDRVREHAKCHEQQERITSLTFMVYEENVSCSENCRYNHKEKHYHCLWADCKHVIGAVSDPVFSRMEHYKQHEHSRAAQGRRVSGSGPMLGTPHGLKRRRGRPPKYQKRELTQVPKIEMTDEEIAEQARRLGPDHCIASGFRRFTPSDPCPDDKCIFVGKEHYHCIRQRCHHATDSTELLSLHAKDFHSYIHILEGFEFFDRTVNCRRPHCHNNKATRHFHCVRPNCDYSFVRVSTMAQHDKKHRIAELGMTPSPTVAVPTMAFMTNHHQQQHGSGSIGNNGGGGGGGGATTPKAVPLVPISVTQAQQLVSIAPNAVVRATSAYFPSRTSAALSQSGAVKGAGLVHVSQTAPITVTMPLRQPVSSQAKVALSSVQPIVIAPITSCALPSTGLTSLVPAANPPGLIAVSSATQPLLLKPLPTGQTEPVMTSAAVSASKTAENGSQIGAQLITIAPKPSPAAGDADVPDKKAAGTAASSQQGMPLTLLLQQKVPKVIAQTSWVSLLLKMQCSPHLNCGRPFCKLKKKDHFHCFDCNQAFSDPLRLKNHITKHGFHVDKSDMLQGRVVPLPDQLTAASVTQEENVDSSASVSEVEENGGSLNLVPGSFSNLLSTGLDQDNESDMAMDLSMSSSARPRSPCPSAKPPPKPLAPEIEQNPAEPVGPESVRPEILQTLGLVKRADEGNDPTVPSKRKDDQAKNGGIGKPAPELPDQASSAEPANPRPAASSPRPSGPAPTTAAPVAPPAGEPVTSVAAACPAPAKAEPAAPAYKKYTYNEDCQFERCAYRQSQSHYHCGQNNCGYAFCDLARFGPHSERHRRLLQLMGDEFEEYRANVDCGRADCEFSKKSSHFHCLRCPFICTDTVKVTVHRKNHAISEAPSD